MPHRGKSCDAVQIVMHGIVDAWNAPELLSCAILRVVSIGPHWKLECHLRILVLGLVKWIWGSQTCRLGTWLWYKLLVCACVYHHVGSSCRDGFELRLLSIWIALMTLRRAKFRLVDSRIVFFLLSDRLKLPWWSLCVYHSNLFLIVSVSIHYSDRRFGRRIIILLLALYSVWMP